MHTPRKANYHTHTARCNHATGADEDYVKAALAGGYTVLGFSDHCPWPYPSGYRPTMRMQLEQLPGYVESVRALADRYAGQIQIPLGLECEYFPDHIDWLRAAAKEHRLDYLLFGNHFYPSDETGPYFGTGQKTPARLAEYLSVCERALQSGLFVCFAHPDLFMRGQKDFGPEEKALSRQLCRLANCCGVPVEYNLTGARVGVVQPGTHAYPDPGFWQVAAEENCTVIIGDDTHESRFLEDDTLLLAARRRLEQLGLKVVDTLPLFDWENDPPWN